MAVDPDLAEVETRGVKRGMEPVEAAIHAALNEAEASGVHGKQLTPFLLARLAQVTGGASIRANRALALHNAEVASALAVALAG